MILWEEVLARLNRARAVFLEQDRCLLEVNANERSITHKFAEHLQIEFPDWKVDCEYNRKANLPKELYITAASDISEDDLDAKTVFPDIIVHHRGQRANLLVIEAKKLTAMTQGIARSLTRSRPTTITNTLMAALMKFVTGGHPDIQIERY